MSKVYRTAMYLRLSRDEEGKNESGSITNQRTMLLSFLSEREDLELAAEFADDGYSGFDFERPQFQEMMKAVKNGEIDCIVVKDLSRLGRNFLKTEEYIQRIFPKLGVRFIAVNNCFDSSRELSSSERLANPIVNLLNEYHVVETSQKVRSVLEHHRRNGRFIGNHTVYGYVIKDKHLEIDPDAADIVRKMFELKVEGMSNQSIGDYLNQCGVKSPLEHKIDKGIATPGMHLREGEQALWSSVSVRRVLENPIYIGTLVQGKTTSVSYRDKRRFQRDPSEMAVFENAHDAIVSDTTFLVVQDLLQKDSYTKAGANSYLFSSFAFCGGCGGPLYHRQDSGRAAYWQCRNKNCQQKGTIKEAILIETVFRTLKMHMDVVLNDAKPVAPDEPGTSLMNLQQEEISRQIEQLQQSKRRLSEQEQLGVISESDLTEMSRFYDAKIQKAEFELAEIQNQKARMLGCMDEIKEQYRKYFEMTELTRSIVVSFIEKIEVFSKEKIRIFFRYGDFFRTGGDINGT